MPNPSTESPSPSQPIPPPGSNGLEDETENDQRSYPRKYKLEDFSQQAINSGQQEINYLMTDVDEKIVAALKEFSTVIARLASPGQVNWSALDNALDEVSKATKKVASIFPPGCGNPSPE